MSLQKAIVYELFAIFLAVVICAVAVAESITSGYLTGPWVALVVPTLIALLGFLKALATSNASTDQNESDPGDDGDDTANEQSDQQVVGSLGHPPY